MEDKTDSRCAQQDVRGAADAEPDTAANLVRLRGRLGADPTERILPSGAAIVSFRVVVAREATVMTRGSRQVGLGRLRRLEQPGPAQVGRLAVRRRGRGRGRPAAAALPGR